MIGYDWPRLHAMLNDLPSALLVAAVFFDLLGVLAKRPALRQAGLYTLVIGTIGAVFAVISGLQAEEGIAHGGAVHQVMEEHEQLAFITLAVFGVLLLWRLFRESRMGRGERWAALVVSILGVGVLFATGQHGGELVFDHAAGIRSEVLQAELDQRSRDHEHGAGGEHGHAGTPDHDHPTGTPAHEHAPDAPSQGQTSDSGSHPHPPGTAPHSH